MKNTRRLFGMNVTEIRAETQEELFLRLAKFAGGKGGPGRRGITSVALDYSFDEDDLMPEIAVVVWA